MRRNHQPPESPVRERVDEKPFLDHLEDLRKTLIAALLVYAGAFLLCIPLTVKGYTLAVLKRPLVILLSRTKDQPLARGLLPTLSPAGGFAVALTVSLEAALVISFPVILWRVGVFILPALTRRERRLFVPALAAGTVLFYAGIVFCYMTTLPAAIRILWDFNRLMGIENLWTINEYLSFATRLLLSFGIVFELPLVIFCLVGIGVLDSQILRDKRRYAIIIILIAAAALTPGPDAASQILMALPLIVLYEISVWGARLIERRRRES